MNKKAEKARGLRYKRAMLEGLNIDYIYDELSTISEACDEVRYAFESESVISEVIDDEEEEFEFRMMFSELSAECEQLYDLLSKNYVTESFNDIFVGITCRDGNAYEAVGYDGYIEDYFRLTSYETKWAGNESYKRLMRMTKAEIISAMGQCFGIAMSFFNIERKYDYLKASFDVIRDKNIGYLDVIKGIEQAYEKAADGYDYEAERKFDQLTAALPDKAWIE